MPAYLIKPKVISNDIKFLTHTELTRLLRKLKSKKSGIKLYAVDVEEVFTEKTYITNPDKWSKNVPIDRGFYYNVHIEYVT